MNRFSSRLFDEAPIVGILRGLPTSSLRAVVESARDGGLTTLEITMNTPGAADQIRMACEVAGSALNVGAGTVTSEEAYESARAAGASFIVTPTISAHVIRRCVLDGVPVFPGAFSAAEILRAWELGATVVKVFPADALGPMQFAELKATLPAVRLMPTGGVDVVTLSDYVWAGADAYGIGTPLFRPDRIAAQDWTWLKNQCRQFRRAYKSARNTT